MKRRILMILPLALFFLPISLYAQYAKPIYVSLPGAENASTPGLRGG